MLQCIAEIADKMNDTLQCLQNGHQCYASNNLLKGHAHIITKHY